MSSTLNILRNRRKRQNSPDTRLQRGSRNTLAGCGFIFSILLVFGVFSLVFSYRSVTNDLPPLDTLETLLNPRNGALLQPTRVYDRSGQNLIYIFSPEDKARRYIPLGAENPQHIPDSLIQATIVLADPDFWTHSGYSLNNLDPESHPTLAQKLVSDLLLWQEKPSLRRAIRERLLAAQLTQKYGRQQIMAWYLNSANYGNHAYGAESAAQLYFEKPLTELNWAESATLAAVSQSPALNPISAPSAAYQHRQETLHILEGLNLLDSDKADAARHSHFNVCAFDKPEILSPAFVPLMLAQLDAFYPQERIARGGLEIISTLDFDLQKESACIISAQVARLSKRDVEICDSASQLPILPNLDALEKVSASAVIIDPVNAQILALVGETTLMGKSSQLSAHKVGSSLSPFIYLTGFTRGLNPASLLWDIPNQSNNQNYDGEFHGAMRLRIALANDYEVPLKNVLSQMGAGNVARIMKSFGVDGQSDTISPLNLAQSYGIFAAEGVMYGQKIDEDLVAVTVLEMRDTEGDIWLNWGKAESQVVVSPELAFLINDILSDGAARWESLGADNALEIALPVAAKIGRMEDGFSAWTVGYTPLRVTAVWAGADDTLSPEASAGIWHALMKNASAELPATTWEMPVGVTKIDVCDPSGLLPTRDCPNIVSEVFLSGSEPSQYDNLYRSFDINRETGYLATVFTPPELVEARTYMLFPDEAQVWAEKGGFATPPASYDAILAPPRVANAHLTVPDFFDDVKGIVEIRGTAAGDGFAYYRVQVGQGLNPQGWEQIGEDVQGTIHDNLLAIWDTSKLSGLYAIQLLVVYDNQQVEISTTQVSVDNSPPNLKILYPQEGDLIDFFKNRQIEFQVEASDNLGIDLVEFYVDFQQIGVVTESPFVWTWASSTGYHHLKVITRDRAGNVVEEIVRFKVEK